MEAELAREFDNEREGKRDWERLRKHMIYKWQQPKSSQHQPEQAKWFHRSNYISCSKAHRRFNYGFQWHYNDFMTENTIAHQWNLEFVTQRNGHEVLGWELCEFDRCARDGCRPRRGCAAGWRRCHSARTRMSPNKHGGAVFRAVGRKWSFCPSCSALSDNMWFWYWHDPEVNETCNKMCQTRRICLLPCRRPFKAECPGGGSHREWV